MSKRDSISIICGRKLFHAGRIISVVAAVACTMPAYAFSRIVAAVSGDGNGYESGEFLDTGSMSTPRALHTATRLHNGKVLVTGGGFIGTSNGFGGCQYGPGGQNASAELYDPVAGVFSPTGSMHEERCWASATLLQDGRVLVAGGAHGMFDTSAEVYDPVTGLFTIVGSMHVARNGHVTSLLPNGRVLVAGGAEFELEDAIELFDPAANQFIASGAAIPSKFGMTATTLPNGTILMYGGVYAVVSSNRFSIYDPVAHSIIHEGTSTHGNVGVAFHTATLLADGRVLMAGGGDRGSQGATNAFGDLFYHAANMMVVTDDLLDSRLMHSAARLRSGNVLITGGFDASRQSAEIYNIQLEHFQPMPLMRHSRFQHTSTLLCDGRVLITGGGDPYDWSGNDGLPRVLNSAELFVPEGWVAPPSDRIFNSGFEGLDENGCL